MNPRGGEGAEVVYALRNNSTLARSILEAIGSEGQIMRKYYQRRLPEDPLKDYYFIIRDTDPAQSLLLEYGFIDNPNDQKKLQNDLLRYVEAVVRAVATYAGFAYIPPSGSTGVYYTVQRGDSLWTIARDYGVTVQELRDANNLTTDTLQIGQVLRIPGQEVTPPSGESTYTVKSGDSLWSIARDYGVTVQELRDANNLTTDTLRIGQVLIIPNQTPIPPVQETETYTVQRGDSLWTIASQFNTTVNELRTLNNLTSDVLQIGQILKVPKNGPTIPDTPSQGSTYTVKSGDSLWSIARDFGTTVDAIKEENKLTTNLLQIGQVLKIPTSTTTPPSTTPIQYTVKSGDSLWSIAREYGTTVDAIRALNGLSSNLLQIGKILQIPRV